MGRPASSIAAKIHIQAIERTAISTALHPPKFWKQFLDGVYPILKHTHWEYFFHHINNFYQSINLTIEEESNGRQTFIDTL